MKEERKRMQKGVREEKREEQMRRGGGANVEEDEAKRIKCKIRCT